MSDTTNFPELTITINGQPITATMDEWSAVSDAISDRRMADGAAWRAAQKAAGQVWLAIYWRHGQRCESEEYSLDDAKSCLDGGSDAGEMSPYGIRCPDGKFLEYPKWEEAIERAG